MHRLSILLLVAAFTISLTLPTFAMEDSNEELEFASQYLSSRGIMVGDGEGNMNFDGPLTRAHLAIYGDAFLDITDLTKLPVRLAGIIKRYIRY